MASGSSGAGSVRGPASYIVRIYRRGFRSLTGVVEDPKSGEQAPFKSMEELWAVLRTGLSSRPFPPRAVSGEPDQKQD
jgi:hypothetical protein